MKRFILIILTLLLSLFFYSSKNISYRIPRAFNCAEAVLEIFWDPEISDFKNWDVMSGEKHGLNIFQNWAAVDFSWIKKPEVGIGLKMTRVVNADCSKYNLLIVGMNAPNKSIVKITAETDIGNLISETEASGKESEFKLELKNAKMIKKLTLEIISNAKIPASGWLSWIILQNSNKLKDHLAQWENYDDKWEKYIKGNEYKPNFIPQYNIFLNQKELLYLRELHHKYSNKNNEKSPFIKMANKVKNYIPENAIKEFAMGDIHIIGNSYKFEKYGVDAAIAGIVLKDENLLRLAARHALSLAVSKYWDYGFTAQFPMSSWELRAFKRSHASEDIAWILDIAGEMFTLAGKHLLLRKISEEGIGPINYTTWKHDNIFSSNQLAFFNTGRMASYLVLEREFKRVKPYTDIALKDSIDNLEIMLLPDGSTYEGPGYFGSLIRRNCISIKQYAKARKCNYLKLLPKTIKKTSNYAVTISSTTEDDHLAICDSDSNDIGFDTILLLASLFPESYWVNMMYKKYDKMGKVINNPFELMTFNLIKKRDDDKFPSFIYLPEVGYIASHRMIENHIVKIFIMGNRSGAEHCHEDKGSFILEFAGDSFATDIGIGSYKDTLHKIYKHAQRHNMLVPVDDIQRARPDNPLNYDVKPKGRGNEKTFYAQINATPGWNNYYNKWIRTWKSSSPDVLTIIDEYSLKKGEAVQFLWQTLLPCEIIDNKVIITGKKGRVIIDIPKDCKVSINQLPMQNNKSQNRIVISKNSKSTKLYINIKFEIIK